ncbi:MAG: hypothetical protein U9R41_07865 [Candidatus Marinimicrobia bacterium]|nr:hypothetical protein [Candidatus Neomarinimicrobiota bacterium]
MGKVKTFGAKIAHREKKENKCPVCGETISYVKHYFSEKNDKNNVKYRNKIEAVCNCNKNDLFS